VTGSLDAVWEMGASHRLEGLKKKKIDTNTPPPTNPKNHSKQHRRKKKAGAKARRVTAIGPDEKRLPVMSRKWKASLKHSTLALGTTFAKGLGMTVINDFKRSWVDEGP